MSERDEPTPGFPLSLMGAADRALDELAAEVTGLQDRLAGLEDKVRELGAAKDAAYSERNQCVSFIAKLARVLGCPAWIGVHNAADLTWERDWLHIVFIELPTGQVSWHIHDSELPRFAFLPRKDDVGWDGHGTAEKYERMRAWSP